MRCETIHLKDYYPFLDINGADPQLDLYLPYNISEMHREHQRRPVILLCPGGGYGMNSQREGEPIALHYFQDGYNVLILKYSVAPHHFPQQLWEAAAAVDMIHRNAECWNCDKNKVAIMGFSAGGHLAAYYSCRYDCADIRQVLPESYPVAASVLCYPLITTEPDYTHVATLENLAGHRGLTESELQKFSCERYVTEKTPPAFLWHTAPDEAAHVQNSLLYAQALSKKQVPFELHIYPFGRHGLATCDEQTFDGEILEDAVYGKDWITQSRKWLKRILR